MNTYHVFARCSWKRNDRWPQGWELFGGAPKTTLATGLTLTEARRMCRDGNEGNQPGVHGQTYVEFEAE